MHIAWGQYGLKYHMYMYVNTLHAWYRNLLHTHCVCCT